MIDVQPAVRSDLSYIDSLQRKNAEELSFYPKTVFEREIDNHRVLLARINGEPAGYLYHGALGEICRIHQACIQYDARGNLYGAALVNWLSAMCKAAGVHSISLRCGSDIEANKFWRAMGFDCIGVTKGGARRMRDINNWQRWLQPQLFAASVAPSEKKQDASMWRARDKTTKASQFIRGKVMQRYRTSIESDG
jgi:GNAT superfamily N-acetyltransferase